MVEIFKTNVEHPAEAKQLIDLLNQHFPALLINFDLQDCDRILRIKGESIPIDRIVNLVSQTGFCCDVLN